MATRPHLPDDICACLFDLDGVLTQTARIHAGAWQEMFEHYLEDRARRSDEVARPFRLPQDYVRHVDGKLRADGVRSFLASRDIVLPDGSPDDPPSAETVSGLAKRKNALFLERLGKGVDVYESSIRFVELVRDEGLACGVVSASENCRAILETARIDHLFDVRVDGADAGQQRLRGKPAPDMFLAAAAHLGAAPSHTSVFEDATAGVQAGHEGGFGWVVGVDRAGHADALLAHGADVVVRDLAELIEQT
jgi:beta-phosphoglucomutase family hydrolase